MDPAGHLIAAREAELRRLLERLEAGDLEVADYTGRVVAVERAEDPAEMAAVVDAPAHEEPTLDPVDLLLLSRASVPSPRRASRHLLPVVMAVFLAVLLLLGVWLVAHARSAEGAGTVGVVSMPATASYGPVPGSPPSGRSSRR